MKNSLLLFAVIVSINPKVSVTSIKTEPSINTAKLNCQEAIHGQSGLWVKACRDDEGRPHLLVGDTKESVDDSRYGAHHHYWRDKDGDYYVQIKNNEVPTKLDRSGHLYPRDTRFNLAGEWLPKLFDRYFK